MRKDIKQKILGLSQELKHMKDVELEGVIASGDSDYFEEISGYISELKNQISSLKEDLTKIEKWEIKKENK